MVKNDEFKHFKRSLNPILQTFFFFFLVFLTGVIFLVNFVNVKKMHSHSEREIKQYMHTCIDGRI